MLAYEYDYPILGIFWTIFMVFIWVAWLMLLIRIFADIIRTHDMGGVAKGLWAIFVLLAPFLGVFIYLIVRGSSMSQREMDAAKANEAAMREYLGGIGGPSAAEQLAQLADLHAKGALTDEEFAAQKAKI